MSIIWEPDLSFVITENESGQTAEQVNHRMTPDPLQADASMDVQQAMDKLGTYVNRWAPDVRWAAAYPQEILALRGDIPTRLRPTVDNPINEFIDSVTYKVVRREPGHVAGGPPFGPMKESKPRLREPYIKSREVEGESYEIWGQRFENLIQFDCWAKSNREAERLIEWFELFLLLIAGPLKKAGVGEMKYWARREDPNIMLWKTPIHVRSLVYYFVTEKLLAFKTGVINSISVELLGIDSQPDTVI